MDRAWKNDVNERVSHIDVSNLPAVVDGIVLDIEADVGLPVVTISVQSVCVPVNEKYPVLHMHLKELSELEYSQCALLPQDEKTDGMHDDTVVFAMHFNNAASQT